MTPPLCFIGDCHGEERWVAHVLKRAAAGGAKVAWALGDFGYWCHTPGGVRFLDRVQGYAEWRGIDLIFLRGNHENQEQLAVLADGATGLVPVRPNVAFAPDGTIWDHAGLRFAIAGGAPSIDMDQRTPGLDWWPNETFSVAGYERLAVAGPVDVVIAHDCPLEVAMSGLHDWPPGDAHRDVMSTVADLLTPRWWLSAHYHRKVSQMVTTRRGHRFRAEILDCDGTMTLGWLLVDPSALAVDGSDPRIQPAVGKLSPNRISLRWSPVSPARENGGQGGSPPLTCQQSSDPRRALVLADGAQSGTAAPPSSRPPLRPPTGEAGVRQGAQERPDTDMIAGPVLYLDVDGVLNPWQSRGPHKYWPDYRRHPVTLPDGRMFKLWCSPSLGQMLVDVAGRHGIEIVWATSWAGHVDDLIVPLVGLPAGLRVLPYAPAADADLRNTGKVAQVAADAGTRPVVWVDDYLGPADRAWADHRAVPTLLIRPRPSVGLRSQDLAEIEQWAAALPTRQAP